MARTKHCRRCDLTKPSGDFQRCKRNADGLQSACRSCRLGAAAAYREAHRAELRASSKTYDANHADQRRAYYLANRERLTAGMRDRHAVIDPEIHRANCRAYYLANRARSAELGRLWREANAEAVREYLRAYCASHPDAFRRYGRKRRALRSSSFVEHVDNLILLERDDGFCGICGRDVDPLLFEVDHIVPLSRGGEHSYENTQIAHPFCNRSKHDRLPHEYEAIA